MKRSSLLLITTILTGCSALAPTDSAPRIDAGDWRGVPESNEVSITPSMEVPANMWERFGNEELPKLVNEALSNNNDISAAIARVEQARATVDIVGSSLLPNVGASAEVGRDLTNPQGRAGTRSAENSYRAGLSVNYELDLFGRNRMNTQAAQFAARATEYDKDALTIIVASDTAQSFIALLSFDDRVAVAENNLSNARDVLRITQARFDVGTLSALELAQQKTALANTEAQVASLVQQRDAFMNQLAVLLGKPPQDMTVKSKGLEGFTLPSVAPLQPSELLVRRPDIRAAEADLQAANYDIGAARAVFFPNFNLSAGAAIGASPASAAAILTSVLAAAISQPIFDASIGAQVDLAKARRIELEENYKKAVLVSFQEVQDALAAEKRTREQVAQYTIASDEAARAYSLVRQRFDAGAIDFLTLLDAQSSMYNAQDALITARQQQYAAVIDLYKALGGGWKEE